VWLWSQTLIRPGRKKSKGKPAEGARIQHPRHTVSVSAVFALEGALFSMSASATGRETLPQDAVRYEYIDRSHRINASDHGQECPAGCVRRVRFMLPTPYPSDDTKSTLPWLQSVNINVSDPQALFTTRLGSKFGIQRPPVG